MTVYAESSAVLAWLLGESGAPSVSRLLAEADHVVSSELTLIECGRVLVRAVVTGRVLEAEAAGRTALLDRAAAHWTVLGLGPEVSERVRRPFPVEPIRTLDAVHLATALVASRLQPDVGLLSLDERVRECGRRMGMAVLPAD